MHSTHTPRLVSTHWLRLLLPVALGGAAFYTMSQLGGDCAWSVHETAIFVVTGAVLLVSFVWFVSEVLILSIAAPKIVAVVAAVALYFALGVGGWLLFPDGPSSGVESNRAAIWIPSWMVGLQHEAGYLPNCGTD